MDAVMHSIVGFESPKHGCDNEPYNNNVEARNNILDVGARTPEYFSRL